jgi:hypothetical protein
MDTHAAPDEPATPTPTDLEDAIAATMQAHAIPGANVLLDRPDAETWTAALGVSDLQHGMPIRSVVSRPPVTPSAGRTLRRTSHRVR